MARPRKVKDFRQDPAFDQLLEKQKIFVTTYIENGLKLREAVRAAYSVTSDSSAHSLGARMLKTPSIRHVLLNAGIMTPGGMVATKAELVRLVSERLLMSKNLSTDTLHKLLDDWRWLTGFDKKQEKELLREEKRLAKRGEDVNAVLERLEREK